MGMFGSMFKGKAKDAINQFSGNKDYLEGMCSACALTAAAEGGIDDKEYEKALSVIRNNKAIGEAFGHSELEKTFARMTSKTGTRGGRAELKQEIAEVIERDRTGQMGAAILYAALDVADEGGIGPEEERIMREIAQICHVDYDRLAA